MDLKFGWSMFLILSKSAFEMTGFCAKFYGLLWYDVEDVSIATNSQTDVCNDFLSDSSKGGLVT